MGRRHEAIDILAPRGTPVLAAVDGPVVDVTPNHSLGGLSVYQVDVGRRRCYYYAHLESVATGVQAGVMLTRGETLGTVGTSGNAPKDTPHLHFAVFQLADGEAAGSCWGGAALNPYSILRRAS